MRTYNAKVGVRGDEGEKMMRWVTSKAAEVRLIRNVEVLRSPVVKFKAERV